MNHATIHPRIQIKNYNSKIGTVADVRPNNRGRSWNYESQISVFTQIDNTALTLGFKNESVTNFKHTPPTNITIQTRFYFIKDIGQSYAEAFISGSPELIPDESSISIALYVFLKDTQYERYVDMLRNEDPVYMQFFCDIDENESNYKTESTPIELLPVERLKIRGLCSVNLNTSGEDVGDGENE